MKAKSAEAIPLVPMLEKKSDEFNQEIHQLLKQYDPSDGVDSFSQIIDFVLTNGIRQVELADQFEVNESTISRWRSGKSQPRKMVRRVVVDEIAEMFLNRRSSSKSI